MYDAHDISTLREVLKGEVGATIFNKGADYFRQRRVTSYSASGEKDDRIVLSGTVRGNRSYTTSATYFPEEGGYWDIECTCPYRYECKHGVALVLHHLETLAQSNRTKETDSLEGMDASMQKAIKLLGIDPDKIPPGIIAELLRYRSQPHTQEITRVHTEKKQASKQTKKPFTANEYVVVLHREHNYVPSFHKVRDIHIYTQITNLLNTRNLSDDEHALLTYLQQSSRNTYSYWDNASYLPHLLSLLAHTDVQVACVSGYNDKPKFLTVNTNPPPLTTQLLYHRRVRDDDPHIVRDMLLFALPLENTNTKQYDHPEYALFHDHVVQETEKELRLHTVPFTITNAIMRMEHIEDMFPKSKAQLLVTSLGFEEIRAIQDLITQGDASLSISTPEEFGTLTVHTETPSCAFVVDLNTTEHTLRVQACTSYGPWRGDLSEEIAKTRTGRIRYYRRTQYEHDDTFILRMIDDALHLIRFDGKADIANYKKLEKQHEALGFTKTLKCARRGKRAIDTYLHEHWPALRTYAQKHGHEIIYTGDTLPEEEVAFTAEFTSDIDEENDWLHFDVDLYCGGDRVTLAQLYTFIESGEQYWRKEDGTLVAVENRTELERLVRLLRSFRAREDGGFEGKLHHAPELSYVMTSSPHYSTAQNESLQKFMKQVEQGKPIKPVKIPAHIKKIARPYQIEGIKWLHFLRSYRFAGILADDMGLGKTLQTLTLLATHCVPGIPSIVVCPKSLLYNWHHEATQFFPKLRVLIYDGTPEERAHHVETLTTYDVVVTSYNTLKRDADVLCAPGRRYNYAVLDEAQYIKNHATKISQRVKEIPADYRLALTGTPLENHVFEVWSIYDYLMPGFLGGHEHFSKHFHRPIMEGGDIHALTHLRHKIEPFMMRRTKQEVLQDLPPKVEQTYECVLLEEQNVLYQQILSDVRGAVTHAVEEKGFKQSQIHILAGLTKLRQVCNHPALLTKGAAEEYGSAKLEACLDIIAGVREGGRKVLVFSQFTGMLDILARTLEAQEIGYTYLSGKTQKRPEVIERFNTDPSVTAFLISMKAGGTGLNLTTADTVIVFDPWWNPSVENQAIDRTHRIGQTQSVNVYRLLTKGTIEEKIQLLKHKKQNLFNAVVNESGDLFSKLTWDDIKELFAE